MKRRILKFLAATYVYVWQVVTSYFSLGENVYNRNWDLLIILDACRIDALQQVQDEYDFISDIEYMTSTGSTSIEWIHNTFTENHLDKIQSTSYVTANGFSSQLQYSDINRLETSETMGTIYETSTLARKMIRNNTISGELGALHLVKGATLSKTSDKKHYHPNLVTAKAIESYREEECEQLIVHYMQPHAPYIAEASDRKYYYPYEENPFKFLKEGGEKSVVWDSYIDNLRLVLDDVEVLLENIDAEEVRITSDHGELFGELGLYSHIYGIPHPSLRRVPWVETTAEDRLTIDPKELTSSHDITSEGTVEERLTNLGYL